MGIEAIYNDSSNNEYSILAQLKRKVQVVLGDLPPLALKAIGTMYTRCSQLVHGGANIFKCWSSEDYSDKDAEAVDRERDYMITATGILIATIRKMIKANANALVETITVSLETQ